ncbi:MAG: S41 family peptidase, partial [Candidatus Pacearchaeota archaeon]|nr:S41 family peptidase [Candidatus Pacearchaeota archaeon]
DFGNGQGQREYRTHGSSALSGFPTVVLMNEGSASASEILAGALRDQLGVKIVGTTSFGKGSVQELERFSDGSALKLTVAHWLTPKGTLIQGKGLDPDVAIEMTDADIDAGRDPQLDSAIEIVKGL